MRGMVPDLPDIGWREPPSAAVFGGISLVHEAAAISASAAYPSPAPIAAAITPRAASAAARAITDRLRRAYSARSDAARPLQRCLGASAASPVHKLREVGQGSFAGVKGIPLSSLRINERQAALTNQNYCDNKITPVAGYQLDLDGFCFAGRSKPSRAKHCRGDGSEICKIGGGPRFRRPAVARCR